MNGRRINETDTRVAERIRAARLELGVSQTALAERLGVSFQQVQKYEQGTNRIGAGRLFDLARALNVPIQALFPDGEDKPANGKPVGQDSKALTDFLLSADGWRLYRAFLQISNPALRKAIISFIQDVADQKPGPAA